MFFSIVPCWAHRLRPWAHHFSHHSISLSRLRSRFSLSADVDWVAMKCTQDCLPDADEDCSPFGRPAENFDHLYNNPGACCRIHLSWLPFETCLFSSLKKEEDTDVNDGIRPKLTKPTTKPTESPDEKAKKILYCKRTGKTCQSQAEQFACCSGCEDGWCK